MKFYLTYNLKSALAMYIRSSHTFVAGITNAFVIFSLTKFSSSTKIFTIRMYFRSIFEYAYDDAIRNYRLAADTRAKLLYVCMQFA